MSIEKNTINAIGRRKTSVARLYLTSGGKGNILINGRTVKDYFPSEIFQVGVTQPIEKLGIENSFDINVNVQGGGLRGQSEAIRLAFARALCEENPANRPVLKEAGYLKRDPRKVERKKYGQKKARKRFQFTKR